MKRNILHCVVIALFLLLVSCSGHNDNTKVEIRFDTADFKDQLNAKSIYPVITTSRFGTIGNQEIFLYTLDNQCGMRVGITNYGAIITSIEMPDNRERSGDVVLGYDSLTDYIANNPYFGAIVGRYANRIAHGKFILDGKTYHLAINNGQNALHGGLKGFDKVVWSARSHSDSVKAELALSYLSRDGEEGYPGNLQVTVTYSLDVYNSLTLHIEAKTDQATPVNICNHTYFNLSEADTNILGHHLTLYADYFTPVDGGLIPTGAILPVAGTAMDFNNSQQIGSRIGKVSGGYDHNYVLAKGSGTLKMAAQLFDPRSGRQVEILTTQPGIQFYSGNFLDGSIKGKKGKVYDKHYGLCLETQHFPDSPNHPAFPSTILRPGEKYDQTTVYQFSVLR